MTGEVTLQRIRTLIPRSSKPSRSELTKHFWESPRTRTTGATRSGLPIALLPPNFRASMLEVHAGLPAPARELT
jgi:hypothetical protein